MDDIKGFVKQYWPYVLGGTVGLWLLLRSSGGQSDGGYGQFIAANNQAALASQQMGMQNAQLQAQIDAAERQSQREYDFGLKQLDMQQQALHASAITAFVDAQSEMAASVSQGAAGVISALTGPSIAAINGAAVENAAAMDAAAMTAASGYLAQSQMVQGTSQMIGNISQALRANNDAVASLSNVQRRPSPFDQLIGIAGQAAQGYFSGGFQ